jgi:hypothetical protein
LGGPSAQLVRALLLIEGPRAMERAESLRYVT